MAVVTLYMSDRDTSKTFLDKKEAENYDKTLELAANVSSWVKHQIDGLSDEHARSLGLLVAENRDLLTRAMKGKSDILLDNITPEQPSIAVDATDDAEATELESAPSSTLDETNE